MKKYEITAHDNGFGGVAQMWQDGHEADRIEMGNPVTALHAMAKRYKGIRDVRLEPGLGVILSIQRLHQWAKRNEARREAYGRGADNGCDRDRYVETRYKILERAESMLKN